MSKKKKPNIRSIEKLVKENPNDIDLGKKVRNMILSWNKE